MLAGLTTNLSYLTILAIVLIVVSYFLLWRTGFGLRLRSVGEAPHAAATLGVRVKRYKYIAVVASGAFAGVGGVFLAEVLNNIYREGQTAGRGYIGLAAMIFGNWRPGGLAAGAGLFGYADALQSPWLRGGPRAPGGGGARAAAVGTMAAPAEASVRQWVAGPRLRRPVRVVVPRDRRLPPQATFVTPYVTTLVVLALATQRLRPPAADGIPYREGED